MTWRDTISVYYSHSLSQSHTHHRPHTGIYLFIYFSSQNNNKNILCYTIYKSIVSIIALMSWSDLVNNILWLKYIYILMVWWITSVLVFTFTFPSLSPSPGGGASDSSEEEKSGLLTYKNSSGSFLYFCFFFLLRVSLIVSEIFSLNEEFLLLDF